ncbi:hypothetical protein C8J56DRAFT_1111426 [Mycena floridula]|nr:hypothetical protein C8J56DRAFT_1111426 [Mycena floridula]
MADMLTHCMDVLRTEAQKCANQARESSNEDVIKRSFVPNSLAAMAEATDQKWSIIIACDDANDVAHELEGQLALDPSMNPISVEIGEGKPVMYQVYIFKKGKYLRKGKWEEDAIGGTRPMPRGSPTFSCILSLSNGETQRSERS